MSNQKAPKAATLAELHDGAAVEMWEKALARVLENIQDPNTDHKAKRQIRLDFNFVANEDRNVGDVEITCSTKLAGMRGIATLLYIGRHEGNLVAVEQPRQEQLFPAPGGKLEAFPGGKVE